MRIALLCLLASSLAAQTPTCDCKLVLPDTVGEVGEPWPSQPVLQGDLVVPRFKSRGLPDGLELDPSGKLRGKPTKEGVYEPRISVEGADGGCRHTWSFELVVGKKGRIEYERLCKKGSSEGARMIGVDKDYFTRAVELRPDLAKAWALRGKALLSADEHKAAIADLDRALAIDSKSGEFHLYRAQARLALERISEALSDFAAAGRLAKSYDVAMQAAKVLEKHEQSRDAEAAYSSAITALENEHDAAGATSRETRAKLIETYLARQRFRLATNDTKGAIADLKRCLALDEKCVTAQVELSRLVAAKPGGTGGHAGGHGGGHSGGRDRGPGKAGGESQQILDRVRIVFEVLSQKRGFDELEGVVDWASVYENDAAAKRRFKTLSAYVRSRKRALESARRPAISQKQVDWIMQAAKVQKLGDTQAAVEVGRRKLCTLERVGGEWKVTRFHGLR